jgi:hypothetical protein
MGCFLRPPLINRMSVYGAKRTFGSTVFGRCIDKSGAPSKTCRRIREEFGSGMFVVAMTGWGREEDKQAALRAGFDTHLTKPPNPRSWRDW